GAGNDGLSGGTGNDTIDGGTGQFDNVSFWDATGPVTASLVTGTSSGGGEGNDAFATVDGLRGGPYADTLVGNGGDNFLGGNDADTFYGDAGDNGLFGNGGNDTLYGGDGNDGLSGGSGDDTLDGGAGTFDSASFWDASGGVTASLATGTSSGGGEGNDTFTG